MGGVKYDYEYIPKVTNNKLTFSISFFFRLIYRMFLPTVSASNTLLTSDKYANNRTMNFQAFVNELALNINSTKTNDDMIMHILHQTLPVIQTNSSSTYCHLLAILICIVALLCCVPPKVAQNVLIFHSF